ncbi:MAG: PKD domain-containing protein [Bacteroidota bacterium]
MNKHNKISNLKSLYSHLFVLLLCITLFSQVTFAQSSSCPDLTVGPNASLCTGCASISATLQGTKATTSYSVSSVAYSPFSYSSGTSVLLGIDDTWSSAITLPFCFEFYGTSYTQLLIGSNGVITFDLANAGGYCPYPLSAGTTIPTTTLPTNSIMGIYEDVDPTNMGAIYHQVVGTTPCRAFVVSFNQIPYYGDPNSVSPGSCSGALFGTYQIVLYESSNNIDINIGNKESCSAWNGGLAIQGIQNAAGNAAVAVAGRNNTIFSASNDSYRFTPTGAPQYTFTWYAPGNVAIGTTPTISVCPTTTTTYTATIVNNTCNGPITFSSPVTVNVTPPPCSGVPCSFSGIGDTVCAGGAISLTASTVTNATYQWTGPNGYSSTFQNPTITNATLAHTGWYIVKDAIPGCSYTDSVFVLVIPPSTTNAGADQTICNSTLTLAGSIGGSATSGTWSGGTGTYSPNNTTLNAVYTPSASEYAADSVILTLTTNDPVGPCTFSSSNVTFHFHGIPVVNFSADDPLGCPVLCMNFTDLTAIAGADSIVSWNWNFGDGSAVSTISNPSHCFSESGLYDIKLIVTSYDGCISSLTQSQFVQVYSIPIAAFDPTPNPASVTDPIITFNDQSSSDVNYWFWDFGDSTTLAPNILSPVHEYPKDASDTYVVTLIVHNADGCYDTVSHEIFIEPEFTFFIPNAFTPNGDKINDCFFGSGVGIIKYDLWIFDRWGDMIFHGKDLNDKWDGKVNTGDKEPQIDVYVWKVTLTDVFNKKHSYIGTVTLTR